FCRIITCRKTDKLERQCTFLVCCRSFFDWSQRMKKAYILSGIMVVILLAAGHWLFQIISEYPRADQEYEELKEDVKEAEKEEQDEKEGEPEVQEVEESGEAGSAEAFTVDFEALQQNNPDVVAWLRIPGVLDYPVVQ